MGYPVLLKAAAGGGGKGMRQVWHEDEFYPALQAAKRESMASFGDDHMLVEKYLTRPRHVEIQVFAIPLVRVSTSLSGIARYNADIRKLLKKHRRPICPKVCVNKWAKPR